jgi:transcriptional regulator with XRE-family HTH domain
MQEQKKIYDTIKYLRHAKKLSRQQMADALHITVSGYGKIERGEVDLTISRLFDIAKILEVSISRLLNFNVSNIFNLSNNHIVQASSETPTMHIYNNEYLEKYVKLLEAEIERLRSK